MNISGPSSLLPPGIKQWLSYKCHKSQQLQLWAQLQTGSDCGVWEWRARFIEKKHSSLLSSWLIWLQQTNSLLELPQRGTRTIPVLITFFCLQMISHSCAKSQTAQYPVLILTRFYSMHSYILGSKTWEQKQYCTRTQEYMFERASMECKGSERAEKREQ